MVGGTGGGSKVHVNWQWYPIGIGLASRSVAAPVFNKEASLMGERVRVHNSLADRKTSLEETLSINEMEKISQLHFLLWLYRLAGVDDRVTVDGMIIFRNFSFPESG